MPLAPGTRLGPYEIAGPLGAGGMGEVYRARDTRLGRDVAVKILPEEFAADPGRLGRFEREAHLLAALNHPNIAAIYGLEDSGPRHALVMELVDGPTLQERLTRGRLPVAEALPLARQIAEGLEYAHERGIVHRDLKPANVKVTPEGKVKLLDFGLAKALALREASPGDAAGVSPGVSPEAMGGSPGALTQSPTLTTPAIFAATQAGVILGTAAYMSPEQARGRPVDRRADIWAFGCVLYEMLTGDLAFAGESITDVLAAIVKEEPDWKRLPSETPPSVRRLLRHCLAKDPRSRVRDIGDARLEIESAGLTEDGGQSSEAPLRTSRRNRAIIALLWAAGGLALALGVLVVVLLMRGRPADIGGALLTDLPLAIPPGVELRYSFRPSLAISQDGRRIAYVGFTGGLSRLFVQDLDQGGSARPVAGTEGADLPFFSPDGLWLGFVAGARLRKVPVRGGDPKEIVEVNAHPGADWSADGTIFFAPDFQTGIKRVAAEGGAPEPVTGPSASFYPQVLPDGEHLIYTVAGGSNRIAIRSLRSNRETIVYEGGFYARYVPTGHIVFAQADTLMAMPFDLATLRAGQPVPLREGLATNRGEQFGDFATSKTGSLVYIEGPSERQRWLVRLKPGRPAERLNAAPRGLDYLPLSVSPDGRRVALSMDASDVWVFDMERRDFVTRLTADPAWEWHPIWTPDGLGITYAATHEDGIGFVSRSADGVGDAKRFLIDGFDKWPNSWSRDGKELVYWQSHPQRGSDLWVWSEAAPNQPRLFLGSKANEEWPKFSPDGHWIAYTSDETGQAEIYVVSYPEPHTKRKVSMDGGSIARWSADGKRIFFQRADWVMVARFSPERGAPTSLPEPFVQGVDLGSSWDTALDGSYVVTIEKRPPPQLRLVLNWFDELKRRVPGGGAH